MAMELDDTELLGRISGGDCVAIEAKYHFSCLTDYRNRYRPSVRERNRVILILIMKEQKQEQLLS